MALDFRDFTIIKLEKMFPLKQVKSSKTLTDWINTPFQISEIHRTVLKHYQKVLIFNVDDWNEQELSLNFIGPVFTLVDFSTKDYNFFAERRFEGKVKKDITLGGKPDAMIAAGRRVPEKPYFFFQEYKREIDPNGDPRAQVLAAMYLAQTLNEQTPPVYGGYVIGRNWHFVVLEKNEYAISLNFSADQDDLFDIYKILQNLKQIVKGLSAAENGLLLSPTN